MDWIEWIIRLSTAFFMVFFVGVAPRTRPSQPPPPPQLPTPTVFEAQQAMSRSDTIIHEVDVLVMESFPMQVQLHVRGEHPDGCQLPVIVEQSREENIVTVSIYREIPGDVFCPMVLQPYEDTIRIDGNFEPGTYVFRVNGYEVEVTM